MSEELIITTAGIVSAYVGHNSVRAEDFVDLLTTVHRKLIEIEGTAIEMVEDKPVPLMPWKKTISRDFLVSLEDGKKYKTLRRHLAKLDLTPEQYRLKWDLPHDYPMTSPGYSERRSEFAKQIGLGRQKKVEDVKPVEPEPAKPSTTKGSKKVTPHPKPTAKKGKGNETGKEAA